MFLKWFLVSFLHLQITMMIKKRSQEEEMVSVLSLLTFSAQGSSLRQQTQRINCITNKSSMQTCREKMIRSLLQIETNKTTHASHFIPISKNSKWITLMMILSVCCLKELMTLLVWLLQKSKFTWTEIKSKSKILKHTVICI